MSADRKPRPRQSGHCSDCGVEGTVELSHDLRRWLCLDPKRCITRVAARRQLGQTALPSAAGPGS